MASNHSPIFFTNSCLKFDTVGKSQFHYQDYLPVLLTMLTVYFTRNCRFGIFNPIKLLKLRNAVAPLSNFTKAFVQIWRSKHIMSLKLRIDFNWMLMATSAVQFRLEINNWIGQTVSKASMDGLYILLHLYKNSNLSVGLILSPSTLKSSIVKVSFICKQTLPGWT